MAKKTQAQPTAAIEDITVSMAVEIMEAQKGKNRPLKKSKVATIAQSLLDGLYVLNGESIVFDEKGVLLDGQHRVAALLLAAEKGYKGVLTSMVVRGVSRALFHTFDQGEKRTLKDVVAMDIDNPYYADIAVALRLLKIRLEGKKVSGGGAIPHSEMMTMLDEHKGLIPWVEFVSTVNKDNVEWYPVKKMISPGYLATVCYLCEMEYGEESLTQIEDFVKRLVDKDIDVKGCPAVALRKVLVDNTMNSQSKMKRDTLLSYAIKSIIHWMENEEVLKIKLKVNEYPKFDCETIEEEAVEDTE